MVSRNTKRLRQHARPSRVLAHQAWPGHTEALRAMVVYPMWRRSVRVRAMECVESGQGVDLEGLQLQLELAGGCTSLSTRAARTVFLRGGAIIPGERSLVLAPRVVLVHPPERPTRSRWSRDAPGLTHTRGPTGPHRAAEQHPLSTGKHPCRVAILGLHRGGGRRAMPSKKAPPSLKPCVVPADMEASCFFAVDCWAIRDNLGAVPPSAGRSKPLAWALGLVLSGECLSMGCWTIRHVLPHSHARGLPGGPQRRVGRRNYLLLSRDGRAAQTTLAQPTGARRGAGGTPPSPSQPPSFTASTYAPPLKPVSRSLSGSTAPRKCAGHLDRASALKSPARRPSHPPALARTHLSRWTRRRTCWWGRTTSTCV